MRRMVYSSRGNEIIECHPLRAAMDEVRAVQEEGFAFQNYSVMCAVERCLLIDKLISLFVYPRIGIRRILGGWGKCFSYVVRDSSKNVLLVATFNKIDETHYEVLGSSHNVDYTDFLYATGVPKEILQTAFGDLFNFLRGKGVSNIYFRQLPDNSITQSFLENYRLLCNAESKSVCIDFAECEDYSSYLATLSRSVRQNIRTAYNRLDRIGASVVFKFYSAEVGEGWNAEAHSLLRESRKLYAMRQRQQYGHCSLREKIKLRFSNYTSWSVPGDNGFLALVLIGGEVAASMEGYIGKRRNGVEIPRLSMNEKFHFYSPGILLINEMVKWSFATSGFRLIDLARGTEKYKYDMGGDTYFTKSVMVDL